MLKVRRSEIGSEKDVMSGYFGFGQNKYIFTVAEKLEGCEEDYDSARFAENGNTMEGKGCTGWCAYCGGATRLFEMWTVERKTLRILR